MALDPGIKNDHIIYAYGELPSGNFVLIIGVADKGIETLKAKKTLLVTPPVPVSFEQVVIFHEPTKEACKQKFLETGLRISEVDLKDL